MPIELKTDLWIDALIRRAQTAGAFAYLSRRGDRDSGSVLVLVRGEKGLTLYTPERDMLGRRLWHGTILDEAEATRQIDQRLDFDPDMNLIEIEDRDNRHFIDEAIRPMEELQADEAAAVNAAKALFRDR
jgi:hypothetical protein